MRTLTEMASTTSLSTGKGNPPLFRSFRNLPHHFRTALFVPLLVMFADLSLEDTLVATASIPTDRDRSPKFIFPVEFAKSWWGTLVLLQALVRVVGCSAIYAFDKSLDTLPDIEDLNLLSLVASSKTVWPSADLTHEVNWLLRFVGTASRAREVFTMVESHCWEMVRNLLHVTYHFPESMRNFYPGSCTGGVNIAWRLSGPSKGGFK
jgi:hypothetical protein